MHDDLSCPGKAAAGSPAKVGELHSCPSPPPVYSTGGPGPAATVSYEPVQFFPVRKKKE